MRPGCASGDARGAGLGRRLARVAFRLRQVQGERAPIAEAAFHHDLAAGLFDEAVDLAEAQPGAAADLLGGVERFEDARQHGLGDAAAGVGDAHGDERPAARPIRTRQQVDRLHLDAQCALAVHRIARVDRKVEQRGVELVGIGFDPASVLGHLDIEHHARADRRLEQIERAAYPLAGVEHLRLQRLAAGEGEQLAGELGRAVDGLADRVEVARAPLRRQIVLAQQVQR